jgi:hypothetical protein
LYQEKTTNVTRFLVLDKRFNFKMSYMDAKILKNNLFFRCSLTVLKSSGNSLYGLYKEGKLCSIWGTKYVLYQARTMFHVRHELCSMWGTNYVPCEARTMFHVRHELCSMWGTNYVLCDARTMSHVRHELFYVRHELLSVWSTNYVPCEARTMFYVGHELQFYTRLFINAGLEKNLYQSEIKARPRKPSHTSICMCTSYRITNVRLCVRVSIRWAGLRIFL